MTLQLSIICRNLLKRTRLISSVPRTASLCTAVSAIAHKSKDPIIASLKRAPNIKDVLAAIQMHLPVMTHTHMLQALTCLFEVQKSDQSNYNEDIVIKNPTFNVLCENFKKHVRALKVSETIEAIKVLLFLKVPADSLIVQTLLQMIRCNINQMNIQQIMFVHFLLNQFDGITRLVDTLKVALPLAFQIQLPLELDKEDLPLLREMFLYACAHDLPDRCINNVVTGLLLHDQTITPIMARSLVSALCQINCTEQLYPTRKQLMDICCDIMVQRIDKLSLDDLIRTIAKLKRRILEKHPEYYHEQFFDAVANSVIDRNVDFEKSLLVARILSRIAHTHLDLVAYLCDKAASNPDTLSKARVNIVFGFINCLSNNNYTPDSVQWNELKRQLQSNPVLAATNSALPWTKVCLELASLNYYDDDMLKMVFSKEFLNEYLSQHDNVLNYLQLLTLSEAVKTFHSQEYEMPSNIIERAKGLYPTHALSETVSEHLAKGLGGSEYVARSVVLPNGIIADVVVCVRGGYPLKITPASKSTIRVPLEELNLPPETVTICIMNFNQGCYSMNSNRLRGVFRLVLDILEKQGFATVAFNISEWLGIPAHERTPYLMREIGYRCGEMGMKLSCV